MVRVCQLWLQPIPRNNVTQIILPALLPLRLVHIIGRAVTIPVHGAGLVAEGVPDHGGEGETGSALNRLHGLPDTAEVPCRHPARWGWVRVTGLDEPRRSWELPGREMPDSLGGRGAVGCGGNWGNCGVFVAVGGGRKIPCFTYKGLFVVVGSGTMNTAPVGCTLWVCGIGRGSESCPIVWGA